MDLSIEQTEKSLAAYSGRLTPAATKQWTAELEQSTELRDEAAQYNRIWESMAALANLEFRSSLAQWEASASEHDDAQLVEWYHQGLLSDARATQVEARAKKDTEFAALLTSSQPLYEGFASLRDQNFREQMAGWEAQDQQSTTETTAKVVPIKKSNALLRRLAVAAMLLVAIGFGLRWYASQNYNPQVLVAEGQIEPRTGSLMSTRGTEEDPLKILKEDIQSAYQQLEVGNYAAAQTAFNLLQSRVEQQVADGPRKSAMIDNLQWNGLLAQIAESGITENNRTRLQAFAEDAQFNYQAQASELLKKTESFWYRWGN